MSERSEVRAMRDRQGATADGVWGRSPQGYAMSERSEVRAMRDRQGATADGVWGRSPQGKR